MSIARSMATSGKDACRFKGDDLEGEVTTKWRTYSMALVSGVMFKARVTHDGGETEVRFLASDTELRNAAEGTWDYWFHGPEWEE